MSAGIDAGILQLASAGRLSAVSCLTQGATWKHQTRSLAALPVDIGLHLNFTESFASGQFFLPLPRLIAACYGRRLPAAAIAAEINAQLDAFEAGFGRPPDYIDGHQHVHQLPMLRESLLQIMALRYPGQGLWLRSTRPPSRGNSYPLKAAIIAMLGARRMRRLASAQGLPMNGRLLGVYDFSASREKYADLLRTWLAIAADGDLLMCHPAVFAEPEDGIGPQRTREFSVLSDSRFPTWLEQQGLTLLRLSQETVRPTAAPGRHPG
ncbi:MAG: ChbG/HpnK family deacetylase [Accumulibacter sp.]|uniref:ChbG/HpnK family deacetylase n=1 Tax=Accumulibacter sp. TaxID=2053492 RepID=UPI0033146561